jgi:small subunit ribosomal protein S9
MAEKNQDKVITESGKRKTAIARATIHKGAGRVRINSVPLEIYEPEISRLKISEPIVLADVKASALDIEVDVSGGGVMGQAAAVRTAIAKALVEYLEDKELATLYRQYDRGLLVSDPRRKLPKKPQGRGARKKRQKSYR